MNPYIQAAEEATCILTKRYSTSFSMASKLFATSIKADIYNIYALVRIADEITDSYKGNDAEELLDDLEQEVYSAIRRGHSTNIVLEAFQKTARLYDIDTSLIAAFFSSMRMDTAPQSFDERLFSQYIHGSAEVVGLMCLKVFVGNDRAAYETLENGAKSLGAAYQKVNFLRDLKADHEELGRYYFPYGSFESFDDALKDRIVSDIRNDFEAANLYIAMLPRNSRHAVAVSSEYFESLLDELDRASAEDVKHSRIRVANGRKLVMLIKGFVALKAGA